MKCEDCLHYKVCLLGARINGETGTCLEFKDKSRFVELPFIAMIEQSIKDGKFNQKQSTQKFNGINAVVYIDKKKWGIPLIDICGEIPYKKDEAEQRLAVLKVGAKQ